MACGPPRWSWRCVTARARCPLRQVASVVEVSEAYLEQLLATLRRAGLVESVQGPRRLSPGQRTGGDHGGGVLRALEGSDGPGGVRGRPRRLLRQHGQLRHPAGVGEDENSLNQVMDSDHLADMLEDELRMRAQCGKAAGGCECTRSTRRRKTVMDKRVYLDHAATTAVHPAVLEAMKLALTGELFGNPSSVHFFGREAKKALDKAQPGRRRTGRQAGGNFLHGGRPSRRTTGP